MFTEMIFKLKKQAEEEMALNAALEFAQSMDKLLDQYQEMVRKQTEALEKTAKSIQEINRTIEGIRTDKLVDNAIQ